MNISKMYVSLSKETIQIYNPRSLFSFSKLNLCVLTVFVPWKFQSDCVLLIQFHFSERNRRLIPRASFEQCWNGTATIGDQHWYGCGIYSFDVAEAPENFPFGCLYVVPQSRARRLFSISTAKRKRID